MSSPRWTSSEELRSPQTAASRGRTGALCSLDEHVHDAKKDRTGHRVLSIEPACDVCRRGAQPLGQRSYAAMDLGGTKKCGAVCVFVGPADVVASICHVYFIR